MTYNSGESFLNKIYPSLHNTDIVTNHTLKSDTPIEKIKKYLFRLEDTHNKAYYRNHLALLKKIYYQKYIIKEIPSSYLLQQERIAREEGYGYFYLDEETREQLLEELQYNQKISLDKWIDYFISDNCIYPTWFKVYAFEGMLKLGRYDKEKKEFTKRTSTTVEPFLDFNREILANIYDILSKSINNHQLTPEEIEILNKGESFKKMYTYFLKIMDNKNKIKNTNGGIWIKYNQGNNYEDLVKSLQGKNTGWCTAGIETAKQQLKYGDFYVYYTKNEKDLYTEPRIAIRMNGHDEIGEIRGIDIDQRIEPEMEDIVSEKLTEFPDKDNYLKKVHHMKLLTEIEKKIKQNIELSKEELIFLYELHEKVQGFGDYNDPRVFELLLKRDIKSDLAKIFGVKKENVAIKTSDFKNNNIIVYYRKFDDTDSIQTVINKYGYNSISNLKYLVNVIFYGLENSNGLNNVEVIYGDCDFYDLIDAKGFTNLEKIYGNVNFPQLKDTTGLRKLKYVYGNCGLPRIKEANHLENLEYIQGSLYCGNLVDSKGFENLIEIGNGCYLWSLEYSSGFKKLKKVGGNFEGNKLRSVSNFVNLEIVDGNIWLPNLEENVPSFKNTSVKVKK